MVISAASSAGINPASARFSIQANASIAITQSNGVSTGLTIARTAFAQPGTFVAAASDGAPLHLSSGQLLFSFVVINVVGSIRKNSLLLIDEPELFLHPTLEIQFVDMLKLILDRFNSKAVMATHSVVTVREVPQSCVHIFARSEDGLVVKQPPFQTFGGDMQRISSYVFGDHAVSKPFERWIEQRLDEKGADELLEALDGRVNEELIVQIRAMGRGEW
ncbi:MAG: AAA family ATPase [Maricaulis sp.]|nr:AAA family ATPase [Maricaulis sp.]